MALLLVKWSNVKAPIEYQRSMGYYRPNVRCVIPLPFDLLYNLQIKLLCVL
jgi:hypothetical protein